MWNYMLGSGYGYAGGYGCGGGFMGITMILVWAILALVIVLLWKKVNNK